MRFVTSVSLFALLQTAEQGKATKAIIFFYDGNVF